MKKREANYRIFGRTLGRTNNKFSIEYYHELLSPFKFYKLSKKENYILDVGSGYGETTMYFANKYSNYKIIACEKYINGNFNLVKKIKQDDINNILIHNGNVHEILDKSEKFNFFDKVFIFFPDPWPKNKHHKRRLINFSFFEKIYEFVSHNGKIYIVTDSDLYKRIIFNSLYESKHLFRWLNHSKLNLSIKDYFDLETKFYKKAIISKRKPTLFILQKL